MRTGDIGVLDDAGYLTLTGRAKEMINRGGEKIAPSEVERAALTLPMPLSGEALAVAGLWQSTLNTDAPAPEDDFFDQGGDSLMATSFLVALETALGRRVDPNILFTAPRFADLLAALRASPSGEAEGPASPDAPREPDFLPYLRTQLAGFWMCWSRTGRSI